MSDYTEKNSNLIPQIDIPCFAWNSQAEQGFLFFKAKSLDRKYGILCKKTKQNVQLHQFYIVFIIKIWDKKNVKIRIFMLEV